MGFKVAVVYYSLHGRLVTLANVIKEGARSVPGAHVTVYRVTDPVRGEDPTQFDEGVLDAPLATAQVVLDADAVIIGAPARQSGMCGEMRLFLDSWAEFQSSPTASGIGALKGKVGSAFTSVGGMRRGFGGQEAVLQSFHATFLQHGMVVVGCPPDVAMEDTMGGNPFGVVMAGKEKADGRPALTESEVKLAYSMGQWTAQVTKLLHDVDS